MSYLMVVEPGLVVLDETTESLERNLLVGYSCSLEDSEDRRVLCDYVTLSNQMVISTFRVVDWSSSPHLKYNLQINIIVLDNIKFCYRSNFYLLNKYKRASKQKQENI